MNIARTPTYRIWLAMRGRCNNPRHGSYARYGGRGIRVCERWEKSYPAFLADMGERPAGLSIEREDNDGPYEPGNCRWATPAEQNRNMSRNRMVTHDGVTLCIADWALREGVTWGAIYLRMRSKGSPV